MSFGRNGLNLNTTLQRSLLNQSAVWLLFRRNYHSCGHAVASFHVQQADTLCAPTGFADGARIHADDFAVLADQHQFRLLTHLGDADHFAVALSRLYIDNAGAAASLEAVLVGGRALAVAVF